MKVLNLYCGIGGNRKLWQDVEVTAVENNAEIAAIYQEFFPEDKIVVGDAHEYLLNHYREFDFIWTSPPCQSHTQLLKTNVSRWGYAAYPDMTLYQQIIWLEHFAKGLYVVENVKSYYVPLIQPKYIGKHFIWANFHITDFVSVVGRGHTRDGGSVELLENLKGISLEKYSISNKRQILRNCTEPELGLHIINCARGNIERKNDSQMQLPLSA